MSMKNTKFPTMQYELALEMVHFTTHKYMYHLWYKSTGGGGGEGGPWAILAHTENHFVVSGQLMQRGSNKCGVLMNPLHCNIYMHQRY